MKPRLFIQKKLFFPVTGHNYQWVEIFHKFGKAALPLPIQFIRLFHSVMHFRSVHIGSNNQHEDLKMYILGPILINI